jgi:hypothetical protein
MIFTVGTLLFWLASESKILQAHAWIGVAMIKQEQVRA